VADHDGRLRQLASWLLAERANHRLDGALAQALVEAAAAEFARLAAAPPEPLVEQLRRTVRRQPAASYSLAGFAAQAGLSKYHFARLYKARTGQSPMAEVRAIRLAHARDLLLTTRLPLKAIARQAGLGDAASLCRLCRQHYRQSPGQLRGRQ
jgi:AraC family transcriptional regulator of adaptative response / methylphosphotriester-DNA alkyltransferase methyltransferase